jgi:hypothetical protein
MPDKFYAYNNKLISPSAGKVLGAASPTSPFNVVSDDDFNNTVQMTYSSITGYNSRYAYRIANPASMLYRKVHVNSSVRVVKYIINTNGTVTNDKVAEFSASQLRWWPAPAYIYDSSLSSIQINSAQSGDSTTYVGMVESIYIEPGNNYRWNYTSIYCDVTLTAGDYWWPLFAYMHGAGIGRTNFGYHGTLNGDLMALRAYNDVSNSTYPPLYILNQNPLPYLHLIDYDGNEYSV